MKWSQMSETITGTFSLYMRRGPVTVAETHNGGPYIRPDSSEPWHPWRAISLDEIRDEAYPRLGFIAAELLRSGPNFGRKMVFRDLMFLAQTFGPAETPGAPHVIENRAYAFWSYVRLALEVDAYLQALGRLSANGIQELRAYVLEAGHRLRTAWPPETQLWLSKQEAIERRAQLGANPKGVWAAAINRTAATTLDFPRFISPWEFLRDDISRVNQKRDLRRVVGVEDLGWRYGLELEKARVFYYEGHGVNAGLRLAAYQTLMLDWLHASDVYKCEGCQRYFIRRTHHGAKTCSDRCRKRKARQEKQPAAMG